MTAQVIALVSAGDLKRMRIAAGLNTQQMSDAIGVGRRTYENWEDKSTPALPTINHYIKFSEACGFAVKLHPLMGSNCSTRSVCNTETLS